jgi:hypothetical protein
VHDDARGRHGEAAGDGHGHISNSGPQRGNDVGSLKCLGINCT